MRSRSLFRCRRSCLDLAPVRRSHNELGPRPPRMPKPVIDTKHIRQNPGLYEINCLQRNYPTLAPSGWKILELHNQCRQIQDGILQSRQELKKLDKALKGSIFVLEKSDDESADQTRENAKTERDEILTAKRQLQTLIDATEVQEKELQHTIQSLAVALPNLSSINTPDGTEPDVLEQIHTIEAKHMESHVSIGTSLGIINIEAAASISGWGFYYLIGAGALLEQALVQHALSVACAAGYVPVSPPSLVYSHAAWACGFQPRDEGGNKQIYTLEGDESATGSEKLQLALTGTAEIPLAGLYMNHSFFAHDLPLKHVGVSRSYRAEAGSRGKDTKGLYRVHEFTKVELFAWTLPDIAENTTSNRFSASEPQCASEIMLQEMLSLQKAILSPLGIPLRVLNQPTSDLGASASIKYDIEGFFPSRTQAPWGELSSLSNCTDYQTRRLGTKVKTADGNKWPHTLNGTAMAVPRVLAALLENNWDPEHRVVRVPACLRKWLNDAEVIDNSRRK